MLPQLTTFVADTCVRSDSCAGPAQGERVWSGSVYHELLAKLAVLSPDLRSCGHPAGARTVFQAASYPSILDHGAAVRLVLRVSTAAQTPVLPDCRCVAPSHHTVVQVRPGRRRGLKRTQAA